MAWTRRQFLKRSLLGLTAFSLLDTFWLEKFFIAFQEYYLGSASEGNADLKIVQVSDLHIRSLNWQLRSLAKKINRLKPDLVAITGDAIDAKENLPVLNQFLGRMDDKIKKVAIVGNWDHWSGLRLTELESNYSHYNCDLLINANKQYTFRGKTITITGVDDFLAGSADIGLALKDAPISDYHVILNHCPEYSDVIWKKTPAHLSADLILSGHTHGGQINLFGYVPYVPPGSGRYLKGWYKEENRIMYVSRGIGTSVLPIRFMARSEVPVFNLKRSDRA